MPFFALLSVFSLWRVITTRKLYWLPILGVSFASCLQSHYLALLLAPTLGIFWLYGVYLFKKANNLKKYIGSSSIALLLFCLMMSPLVIFDSRHGWRNFDALKKFFFERQTTVSARPWNALPELWPQMQEIISRLVAGRDEVFGSILAAIILIGLVLVLRLRKRLTEKNVLAFVILVTWLVIALLGMGLYKQEIYDHYYGFFFVAPFMLFGGISYTLIKKAKIRGWWLVGTVLLFVTYFNFIDNPLKNPPNRQLARTEEIAEKIKLEAAGEKFNLAVLAERNYEDAYQYFLEKENADVIDIDPLRYEETVAEQLFVVCELPEEKCQPTTNEKTEIANFGWSEVDEEWEVSGVILYRLTHVEN
jgi:hypothetical protein